MGSVLSFRLALRSGVTAHLVIAKSSQVYPRDAWYFILVNGIIFLFEFPLGTVLGGITITLLFTLQTFKNMKTVEHAAHLHLARRRPG